ncbi:MAG: class I SAM-dependent rRNA methyltransferase [Archangiaceae bacterium]|nr:class I SAM-dependent rRNA methyltransferase [Archangiaceae bacterium]
MKAQSTKALPVVVSGKAAKQLRRGYPWVYRQDVESGEGTPGGVVDVVDGQKNPIGQALWASESPIALRLMGRAGVKIDDGLFERRLGDALRRRAAYAGRDAFRMVHGEADGLPGLFVDRYGPALVMQALSEGMNVRREALARMLCELTGAKLVVARDDGSGRDFEKLPREKRVLIGNGSTEVQWHEGVNVFTADLMADFKTGSFLDQVDNHLRAAELGGGEALDAFSYHGGFALALSRTCSSVLAIEQDEQAAARCAANVTANRASNVTVHNTNAFDVLKAFDTEGRKFDTIVIDPPGLLKRKAGQGGNALRAYHELNLRAMKCLRPEGLLVSCSCSGKLSRDDFEAMLKEAASDAKRQVQVLERRGAGLDHPMLFGLHETEYLKCYLLRMM